MEGNRMLAEFKVRNYKNFRDELLFSLESEKNYEFNQEAIHNGIIKDSVIVGYNASGKTNLGWAIMDIIIHLTDKTDKGVKKFQIYFIQIYIIRMILYLLHINLNLILLL